MIGRVKSMKTDKGFGFIVSNGKEYFFHKSGFRGHWDDFVEDFNLPDSAIDVEFDKEDSPKGLRATNVRRLDFPNQAS